MTSAADLLATALFAWITLHPGNGTGLTVTVQEAPGVGSAYDVPSRLEDSNGDLLGGKTGAIADVDTAAALAFDDKTDPKEIDNPMVIIEEG